ncbi:DUF6212 domain-containing protein [Siccirubricoccus phaeus]|uniref:DUF6212 domain-containing protein n=1 Tax=Siccirubricoccus phaeus TaxID=2595053 RepID=UPI0011F2D40B|nr:DUF6212 domain-containing protein [Siccirubricoccus phaeus]
MTPRIEPALLAEFHRPAPLLLAAAGLPGLEALALPGLGLWLVDAEGRLHRPGGDPARATQPLAAVPGEVLAMIGPPAALDGLRGWWAGVAPELPPLLPAGTGAEALPGLLPLLAAALAPRSAAAGEWQRALVAARQEAEALREAMHALLTEAGPPPSLPPPALARAAEPDPRAALAPAGGRLVAGQALGLPLSGLTALALHLAEAAVGGLGRLRLRLHGAESGRVMAAWDIPGEALAPGWLALDLPQPLGPVREGAVLDLAAELGPGDALRLSLEDRESDLPVASPAAAPGVPPDRTPDGAPGRALALRAWTASHGRRFVQPLHWDAEAVGLDVAPHGVRVALPESLLLGARLPLGRVERRALGREAPRLTARLRGGEAALILLPAVPLNGLDLLTVEFAPALGDAMGLEAALWLQPEGALVAGLEELSLEPPGARWSGWRGAPAGEGLTISLALPLAAPRAAMVALALRHGGAPEAEARLELAALYGRRVAQPSAVKPRRRARLPETPEEAGRPRLAAARLEDSMVLGGGSYRHLDISLEGVRAGGEAWPRLRFKFVISGGAPVLEFRARPDWPAMFEQWPEDSAAMRSDKYGPYLWLTEAALAEGLLDGLALPRDRAMLAAVLTLLPGAVATVARDATTDPVEFDLLLGKARRLAAAL